MRTTKAPTSPVSNDWTPSARTQAEFTCLTKPSAPRPSEGIASMRRMASDPSSPQDDLAELERLRDELCRSIERMTHELERIELRLLRSAREHRNDAKPADRPRTEPSNDGR